VIFYYWLAWEHIELVFAWDALHGIDRLEKYVMDAWPEVWLEWVKWDEGRHDYCCG
jgi:hypothetical protein